jgi:retinol dehydrogenase 12
MYGPGSGRVGSEEIWTAIVHPGLVESQLNVRSEISGVLKMLFSIYGAMGGRIDGDKGSWTSLFCAASPAMGKEHSGIYFQRFAKPGAQSSNAKDLELARRLETWTLNEMKTKGWIE